MKNLSEYMNESLATTAISAGVILAACFCIPNGVSAVYQLLKRSGKKKAHAELLGSVKDKLKKEILALKLDFSKLPACKNLIDLLSDEHASYDELIDAFGKAKEELKQENPSGFAAYDVEMKGFEVSRLKTDRDADISLHWLISPSEFLEILADSLASSSHKSFSKSHHNHGSFGGGSTFGGGAGAKW